MRSMLQALREGLARTRQAAFGRIAQLLGATEITPALWEELEAALIQADVGVRVAQELLDRLRERVRREGVTRAEDLRAMLKAELRALLKDPPPLNLGRDPLEVVLVVGVNGSGKTTTVAKLAHRFRQQGRRVLLAAADTFRAAAGEQLEIWAERAGVPCIGGQPGADPGAVLFDALQAARARGYDLVLADTAGRLHTKYNLMQELQKVRRVAAKAVPGAPHEVWLVLDATTGQNALPQAREFHQAVGVTGLILTKLDGTAKGGAVFAIARELGLPVRFVGVGEGLEDLLPFDADAFVEELFEDATGSPA
ncbi:MAG: signal recognition particle-docking protein FtsY [Thermoflexus sp.]|jgi:fused signal recognition particle receptor|uniref:signal recognition particle-docking protein FtsY n=1 Tax=Thermoflexus sp. TaxID=1969742 RepID=UPI0028CED73D|nr:signal recognition particle-docking protein FtsY [Thermoflexus sp.]MDT7883696.1 signal recognition particle-docking protein FtsY [Thermoflexus sp.]MDT7949839.1 signal recognition particle-docking protein FtsY [Thermoflexus sp.]